MAGGRGPLTTISKFGVKPLTFTPNYGNFVGGNTSIEICNSLVSTGYVVTRTIAILIFKVRVGSNLSRVMVKVGRVNWRNRGEGIKWRGILILISIDYNQHFDMTLIQLIIINLLI